MYPKVLITVCVMLAVSVSMGNSDMPAPKGEITLIADVSDGLPPPYNPEGKIDPFMPLEFTKKVAIAEPILVPDTPLTSWILPQLVLTCTLLRDKGNMAFFNVPGTSRTYSARIGDYVGVTGVVVKEIRQGYVVMSNNVVFKTKK